MELGIFNFFKLANLDKNRIAVSVFKGDENAPLDEESINIWKNIGISDGRIARLSKKDNWWEKAGETGPCGPDSEIFYWTDNDSPVPENLIQKTIDG